MVPTYYDNAVLLLLSQHAAVLPSNCLNYICMPNCAIQCKWHIGQATQLMSSFATYPLWNKIDKHLAKAWENLKQACRRCCRGTCLISRMLSCLSDTSNSSQSLVSLRMLSLVTPGNIVPSNGGVIRSLTLLLACVPDTPLETDHCHLVDHACMADYILDGRPQADIRARPNLCMAQLSCRLDHTICSTCHNSSR